MSKTSPAYIINADKDGSCTSVFIDNHSTDLKPLQQVVGGYIQLVPLNSAIRRRMFATLYKLTGVSFPKDAVAFCNEDGIAQELPFNEVASVLLGIRLLGNVIIIGNVTGDD